MITTTKGQLYTTEVTPGERIPYALQYINELRAMSCCSPVNLSDINTDSQWNILAEIQSAKNTSHHHYLSALAFISVCNFQHGAATFQPFSSITAPPPTACVRDKYIEFSNALPQSIELTSVLELPANGTQFVNVPYRVVQYAHLNIQTLEVTFPHSFIFWKKTGDPIRYEGIFAPKDYCKWRWPRHP